MAGDSCHNTHAGSFMHNCGSSYSYRKCNRCSGSRQKRQGLADRSGSWPDTRLAMVIVLHHTSQNNGKSLKRSRPYGAIRSLCSSSDLESALLRFQTYRKDSCKNHRRYNIFEGYATPDGDKSHSESPFFDHNRCSDIHKESRLRLGYLCSHAHNGRWNLSDIQEKLWLLAGFPAEAVKCKCIRP